MGITLSAFGRGRLTARACQGNATALANLAGQSINTQVCYPGATASIYVSGTLALATVYSNSTGTPTSATQTADANSLVSVFAEDGDYDIAFSGAGIATPWTFYGLRVATLGGSVSFSVRDFGAVPSDGLDDTAAFQAAAAACTAVPGKCVVTTQCGTYLLTDTISITKSRVHFKGCGQQATIIDFEPTSGKPVFYIDGTLGTLAQDSISGFGFTSTNITFKKTMVKTFNVEEVEINDVASADAQWKGATSVGIEVGLAQTPNVHDVLLAADLPLWITGVGLDHGHFWNIYTIAQNNPNILVDPAVQISSTTFDGYEAWVRGTAGFFWAGTNPTSSLRLKIANVRWEQEQSATGYLIDIAPVGTALGGLVVENVYGGLSGRGVHLRNASQVTLRDFAYIGSSVGLDIDSTVSDLQLFNFNSGGGTVNTSGTRRTFGSGMLLNTQPIPYAVSFWQTTTSANPNWTAINYPAVQEGANQRMGQATMVGGTVTVSNNTVTANTRIFFSRVATGAGVAGGIITYTINPGVSFTLNSGAGTDTSTFNWLLIEPAP